MTSDEKEDKMKKAILPMFCMIVVGCSTNYRAEGVNAEFPDAEVSFVPSHNSDFIVRTRAGDIYYARCDNPFTNTVTSKALIFKGRETK